MGRLGATYVCDICGMVDSEETEDHWTVLRGPEGWERFTRYGEAVAQQEASAEVREYPPAVANGWSIACGPCAVMLRLALADLLRNLRFRMQGLDLPDQAAEDNAAVPVGALAVRYLPPELSIFEETSS